MSDRWNPEEAPIKLSDFDDLGMSKVADVTTPNLEFYRLPTNVVNIDTRHLNSYLLLVDRDTSEINPDNIDEAIRVKQESQSKQEIDKRNNAKQTSMMHRLAFSILHGDSKTVRTKLGDDLCEDITKSCQRKNKRENPLNFNKHSLPDIERLAKLYELWHYSSGYKEADLPEEIEQLMRLYTRIYAMEAYFRNRVDDTLYGENPFELGETEYAEVADLYNSRHLLLPHPDRVLLPDVDMVLSLGTAEKENRQIHEGRIRVRLPYVLIDYSHQDIPVYVFNPKLKQNIGSNNNLSMESDLLMNVIWACSARYISAYAKTLIPNQQRISQGHKFKTLRLPLKTLRLDYYNEFDQNLFVLDRYQSNSELTVTSANLPAAINHKEYFRTWAALIMARSKHYREIQNILYPKGMKSNIERKRKDKQSARAKANPNPNPKRQIKGKKQKPPNQRKRDNQYQASFPGILNE